MKCSEVRHCDVNIVIDRERKRERENEKERYEHS